MSDTALCALLQRLGRCQRPSGLRDRTRTTARCQTPNPPNQRGRPPFGRPSSLVTSLDFVGALPADDLLPAAPMRDIPHAGEAIPRQVPGIRPHALVPPLPVLEISIYRTPSFPRL